MEIIDLSEAYSRTSPRSTPKRDYYDKHKPPSAPSSQRLTDTYESWTKACRAARGLTGVEPGARPWTHGYTGKREPADYTQDEIVHAVLQCAASFSRMPTSNAYFTWAAAAARLRRRDLRIASPTRHPCTATSTLGRRSRERPETSWNPKNKNGAGSIGAVQGRKPVGVQRATNLRKTIPPRRFRRRLCASEPGLAPAPAYFYAQASPGCWVSPRFRRPTLTAPHRQGGCFGICGDACGPSLPPGRRRHVLAVLRILWMPLTGDRQVSRKSHFHLGVRNPGGLPRRLRSSGGL
jgi:hypothetical protein